MPWPFFDFFVLTNCLQTETRPFEKLVPPARFEHAAPGLGIPCSIHLSYGGWRCEKRTVFDLDRQNSLSYSVLICQIILSALGFAKALFYFVPKYFIQSEYMVDS